MRRIHLHLQDGDDEIYKVGRTGSTVGVDKRWKGNVREITTRK